MTQFNRALFDSFNARFLEPKEVAETFVPSNHFYRIAVKNHCLVIGPRGSGKTTLLTMLQRQALDALQSRNEQFSFPNVDFVGVFIPTDVSWSKQIESLGFHKLQPDFQALFADAAFTTHVLRRLVQAMEYEVERNRYINFPEAEIVRLLCSAWHFDRNCASFSALRHLLTIRSNEVHAIAKKEAILGENGREERIAHISFLHSSLLACVSLAVELFDDARKMPEAKWGLMFDELELAPPTIRNTLLQFLRSVNPKLIFKLSLVPVSEEIRDFTSVFAASDKNDFTVVQLWNSSRKDGYDFSRCIWDQLVRDTQIDSKTPEEVLGTSVFDTDSEEWADEQTAYHPGSRLARRIQSLRQKDPSFAKYLKKMDIDVEQLDRLTPKRRAATVRKVTSIVAIRDSVLSDRTSKDGTISKRSREVLEIYSGASAMFTMLEGNPRWMKAVLGDLIKSMKAGETTITSTAQARSIERAAIRFRALLRTIPCPSFYRNQPTRGILSLIDVVGEYFSKCLVENPFSPDPPGTFTVPSRISDELTKSIGAAVNAGAIVWIPQGDLDILSSSLRGKELRLSYLFSPIYPLLLRAERAISLQTIIDRTVEQAEINDLPLFNRPGNIQ
jgi:hypothetical protein